MKISGTRFVIITILILLIPIYGNWELLLFGEKTKGVVVKTIEENTGMLTSYFSAITFTANQKQYIIKGPENLEYEIGKEFSILYLSESPQDAIIFSIKGIYLNRLTAITVIIFLMWMAFYLSFSPKRESRNSNQQIKPPKRFIQRKRLN